MSIISIVLFEIVLSCDGFSITGSFFISGLTTIVVSFEFEIDRVVVFLVVSLGLLSIFGISITSVGSFVQHLLSMVLLRIQFDIYLSH